MEFYMIPSNWLDAQKTAFKKRMMETRLIYTFSYE